MKSSRPLNREQAWNYALRLLNQRGYSEYSLKQKLAQRSVTSEDSDTIIEKLKKLRFLDDQAYAKSLYRSQSRQRQLSSRAIAYKLQQKGVHRSIIDQTLTVADDDVPTEQERAMTLALRHRERMNALPVQKRKERLMSFLYRKGFPVSVITTVTRRILQDCEP